MVRSKYFHNISESILNSEETRYGAHQGSNWPHQNQYQQQQNYPRPQNFYPGGKNTNNRNLDYRSYERNHDNRYGNIYSAPGEKKPFYEGPNPRNKPHQASVTTGGTHIKEKSSLDTIPQSYRPTKQYNEYDDRNNGRYSPPVERNYQNPASRSYYNPRVPYQRSISENYGNRIKDTPLQKSRYFDKSVTTQNIYSSSVDNKYPFQNRPLASIPENLRRIPNTVHNSMPELPITSQPRREINELISDPTIQNYLSTNHKRYLVLHANGTVEHVDSLESIVQSYPNFVMFKAGDILTNPQSSTLEFTQSTPKEEFFPKIPEVGQQIFSEQNKFPSYGYNSRVPYVTEKTYVRHLDKPIHIPNEDDAVSDDTALVVTTTPAPIDTSTFFVDNIAEPFTRPSVDTITDYKILSPARENDYLAHEINKDYMTSLNYVETTTAPLAHSGTTSEFTTPAIVNTDHKEEIFTELSMEITTGEPVTEAQFWAAAEDYTTFAPVTNPTDQYLNTEITTEHTDTLEEDNHFDILSKLINCPSALGKFIQKHFGAFLPAGQLNNATRNKIGRRIREVARSSDPFDVSDILEAIRQLGTTDETTTETGDILFNPDDSSTSSPIEMASTPDDYQTTVLGDPKNNNEEENSKDSNPFLDMNLNPVVPENIDSQYNPVANDDNNNILDSLTSINYETNPFNTFYTAEVVSDPFEYVDIRDIVLSTTESESRTTLNPIIKDVTNPFIKSTTQDSRKQRKNYRNKKKTQPIKETNYETIMNPFIKTTESSTVSNDKLSYSMPDTSIESDNDIISNPFTETNPFVEGFETSYYRDYELNPFTENYVDDINYQSSIETATEKIIMQYDELGSSYDIDIVPIDYLSSETSSYEFTSTPEPVYDLNIDTGDYNEVVPIITPPGEDETVLTTTEKPAVWFKTDAALWEKLANGTIPYDIVYLFQVHDQPLVEKDTRITTFPNGTIVQEFIETVWEREGDSKPIIVQSSKTVYPEEEP